MEGEGLEKNNFDGSSGEQPPEELLPGLLRPGPGPEDIEGIPAVDATAEEMAGYLIWRLGLSEDPEMSPEKFKSDQSMNLFLAKELLPKMTDEEARDDLKKAIDEAEKLEDA
ncbi:MAG: hypothetical protein AAB867_01345 [Patescibacteria group bacterium]